MAKNKTITELESYYNMIHMLMERVERQVKLKQMHETDYLIQINKLLEQKEKIINQITNLINEEII